VEREAGPGMRREEACSIDPGGLRLSLVYGTLWNISICVHDAAMGSVAR